MRVVHIITSLCGLFLAFGCSNQAQDCIDRGACVYMGGYGGTGGSPGAGGTGGAVGGGGSNPGGGGVGGMPECMTDANCTDATKAQCDTANNGGTCVPCTSSPQCAGVAGLPVCDGGTCIECMLGEEGACGGGETCDLLAKECVPVAPLSVGNCLTCTNDTQCMTGHRCIPMEFEMAPHGHYCLKEDTGGSCTRPFGTLINQPSISGVAAVDYCAIAEDLATCEAVNALAQGWVCEVGMTDGMCGPSGMAEQAVPGALCRTVGGLANQCTYACSIAGHCPTAVSCDDGPGNIGPPNWCGG